MVSDPLQVKCYENSRRIGRTLAQAALAAQQEAREHSVDRLKGRTRTVQCPLRKIPKQIAERAEREVEAGFDMAQRNFNELHSAAAYVLSKTRDRFHSAEIIVFRIGSLGLVGLPGEAFVEIGREIEKKSSLQPTVVIGLTGGSMGYMPHPEGYKEGGYEAGYRSARYDPVTPTRWIKTALEILRDLSF